MTGLELIEEFIITQRHYDLIIQQAKDKFPEETGGFLGGADSIIKAVLPVGNISMEGRKERFTFLREEFQRAHEFFGKHGLGYYGVYHSHPQGEAWPSFQDLKMSQRYQFILGLKEKDRPELAAFICKGLVPVRIPIKIMGNTGITPVDIHGSPMPFNASPDANPVRDTLISLEQMVQNIQHQRHKYDRQNPLNDRSDFSTFA